jgi:hypothetical protein
MQQVTLADDADTRLSALTTGTPLIPRSDRSAASACTDASGSMVITSLVITSLARMAAPHYKL